VARHELIVGDKRDVPISLEDSEEEIAHVDGVLRLRRLDGTGTWSPVGAFGSGEILVEVWRPTALRELTGFWAEVVDDRTVGDLARFRLSADGGATQLFWDGATWRAPADATEWNFEEDVDAGISSFSFVDSVAVFLRLESGDGSGTPSFTGHYIWWESAYDVTEDIVRSIHGKLMSEVAINAEEVFEIAESTDEVNLTEAAWGVDDPVQVFNTTDDPQMTQDLFSLRVGPLITLTSPQLGVLTIRFRGRLKDAHVASDADFELSRLPVVVIANTAQPRVHDYLAPFFEEPLRSLGVGRIRTFPPRHIYDFMLRCVAQYDLHAKKLADAVRRAFDARQWVRSLALDEEFPLVGLESVTAANAVEDQVFTRTVHARVAVLEWLPSYREVPLATDISLRLHPVGSIDGALGASPE
jgi:hypothetical protein